MTEMMRLLAVFLEMCKSRGKGTKRSGEKQNRCSVQTAELFPVFVLKLS